MALTGWSVSNFLSRSTTTLWNGSDPLFINGWGFRPQDSGQGDMVGIGDATVSDEVRTRANNGNTICQDVDNGSVNTAGTGIQAPNNTWFSLQGNRTTSNLDVWLNGANNAGGNASGTTLSVDEIQVGRSILGSIWGSTWGLAEVSLWDTTGFSQTDLNNLAAKLATGGAGGNGANPLDVNAEAAQPWTGQLLAYWRLENTSDICDLSGNGHDLALNGTLSNHASHPPVDTTTASCGVELLAEAGAVDIVGQDATFLHDRVLAAEAGAMPIAGSDALFVHDRVLVADPGALSIVGSDAAFVLQGAPALIVRDIGGPAVSREAGGPEAAHIAGGPEVARISGGPEVSGDVGGPETPREIGGPEVSTEIGGPEV